MTDELPDDLMMPASCPACHQDFTVAAGTVVAAVVQHLPLPCPHCVGALLAVTDLAEITFFSQAEWDAWDDTDPAQQPPEHYHLLAIAEVVPVIVLPPMSMN